MPPTPQPDPVLVGEYGVMATMETVGFARFFGASSSKAFAKTLVAQLGCVQGHYGRLFEDAPPLATIDGKFAFPADADDRETLKTLSRLGFKDPRTARLMPIPVWRA